MCVFPCSVRLPCACVQVVSVIHKCKYVVLLVNLHTNVFYVVRGVGCPADPGRLPLSYIGLLFINIKSFRDITQQIRHIIYDTNINCCRLLSIMLLLSWLALAKLFSCYFLYDSLSINYHITINSSHVIVCLPLITVFFPSLNTL